MTSVKKDFVSVINKQDLISDGASDGGDGIRSWNSIVYTAAHAKVFRSRAVDCDEK